jgi:hypothetical protein
MEEVENIDQTENLKKQMEEDIKHEIKKMLAEAEFIKKNNQN